jgi:hypothetical protein
MNLRPLNSSMNIKEKMFSIISLMPKNIMSPWKVLTKTQGAINTQAIIIRNKSNFNCLTFIRTLIKNMIQEIKVL